MKMGHIDVSAKGAKILLRVLSIPWFGHTVFSCVVSFESSFLPFKPLFLVQDESTITPTIEPNAFVVVVQLKVSSNPSNYQVRSSSVSQFVHVRIVALQ